MRRQGAFTKPFRECAFANPLKLFYSSMAALNFQNGFAVCLLPKSRSKKNFENERCDYAASKYLAL